MKNGKPGQGFTDLEFEAEALRRIESAQRLLVTSSGEELVSFPGNFARHTISCS